MNTGSVKLNLLHGDAHRLRTAEVFNWNGKALAAPRAEFDELLAREELRRPGVYIQTGADPESSRPMVHIAESSDVAEESTPPIDTQRRHGSNAAIMNRRPEMLCRLGGGRNLRRPQ
jgi:hypothetical protein